MGGGWSAEFGGDPRQGWGVPAARNGGSRAGSVWGYLEPCMGSPAWLLDWGAPGAWSPQDWSQGRGARGAGIGRNKGCVESGVGASMSSGMSLRQMAFSFWSYITGNQERYWWWGKYGGLSTGV